jgi:hypothetical protein
LVSVWFQILFTSAYLTDINSKSILYHETGSKERDRFFDSVLFFNIVDSSPAPLKIVSCTSHQNRCWRCYFRSTPHTFHSRRSRLPYSSRPHHLKHTSLPPPPSQIKPVTVIVYKLEFIAHFSPFHYPLFTVSKQRETLPFWSPIPLFGVLLLQPAPFGARLRHC